MKKALKQGRNVEKEDLFAGWIVKVLLRVIPRSEGHVVNAGNCIVHLTNGNFSKSG